MQLKAQRSDEERETRTRCEEEQVENKNVTSREMKRGVKRREMKAKV